MLAFFTTTLVVLGLGAWFPRLTPESAWLGARTLGGYASLIGCTFLLHTLGGVGLRTGATIVAAVAAVGLVRLVVLERLAPRDGLHPVFLFFLIGIAVIAVHGLTYQPVAWDELSSWLYLARHITRLDSLTTPGFDATYGPGWLIALAFPSLVSGSFAVEKAALVPFVMHVALLGLAFDAFRALAKLRGVQDGPATLAAWVLVLAWLTAEATWRLVPTNLLIEKPQIYFLTGCLLLALVMLEGAARWVPASLQLGVLLAGGYLIKVSMLAFAGPAVLLWAWAGWRHASAEPRPWSDAGRARSLYTGLAATIVPLGLVYLVWRTVGSAQSCLADPLQMIVTAVESGETVDRALDLGYRLFSWIGDYLLTYKLPLTLLAVAGFATMTANSRQRPLVFAFALYLTAYFGALYVYHLFCFGSYYFEVLNSPDRFTRVPLRVLHAIGLFVLALGVIGASARLSAGRLGHVAMAGMVVLLGAWQIWQVERSLRSMATRFDAPGQAEIVLSVRREAEMIARVMAPGDDREVLLLAQGSDGYHYVITWFFADDRYRISPQASWGETPRNAWMIKATPEEFRLRARSAAMVWPLELDEWIVAVLKPAMDNPRCLEDGANYLVPDGETFRCRPKPSG